MFFPVGGQQNTARTFQLVQFDTNLLGAALNANVLARTASTYNAGSFANVDKIFNMGPVDVIPPWMDPANIAQSERSLSSRIGDARNVRTFINERDPDVRRAGDDKDSRTLFTLYKALETLKTLAEYASQKNTPTSSLDRLNEQFRKGLAEVIEYLPSAETDRLSLVLGKKNDDVKSTARLGDNAYTYVGDVAQTGDSGDVLTDLTGTETFNIRLTKNSSGDFDDVLIDLSLMSGDLSLNNIVDFINEEVDKVTIDDGSGTQVPKYVTNFSVNRNDDGDYGIQIDGASTEQVTFTATSSEPALIVSSTTSSFLEDSAQTGLLTKLTDIESSDPTRATSDEVQVRSVDIDSSRIAEAAGSVEEDGESALSKFEKLTGTTVTKTDSTDTTDEEEPTVTNKDTANTNTEFSDPVYATTTPKSVITDSQGFSYVIGTTEGSMGSQINTSATQDVFLSKVDSNGNVIYSRLLGANESADGFDIALDSNDNVIITGQTTSNLTGTDALNDSTDLFVAKFNKDGTEEFRYQLDGYSKTSGVSVAVDANDDIIIGGSTTGSISATSGYNGGSSDNLLIRLDGATGVLETSSVIGTSGSEAIKDIAIAADGNILMTTVEDGNAYLKKVDATDYSSELYSQDLGVVVGGSLGGLAVDGSKVYIAGTTSNTGYTGGAATVTNSHSGDIDGYVTGFTDNGGSITADFTTFIGGTSTDRVADIVTNNGMVYVAGETSGTIAGNTRNGNVDAFVAKIDGSSGNLDYVEQYGQALGETRATSLSFSTAGTSVLNTLGLPSGDIHQDQTRDITTQTSINDGDFFYIAIDGGAKRKITINEGDTFSNLARKLNTLSFRGIKAEVVSKTTNPQLKITAQNGSEIEFFAGKEGRDALAGLGIAPSKLVSSEKLFNPNKVADGKLTVEDLGGLFDFGIDAGFNLKDKTTAKYVFNQLTDAASKVERAFRSLTFSIIDLQLLDQDKTKASGPAPAYLTARTAQFQDALLRIQSANFSQSSGFLI